MLIALKVIAAIVSVITTLQAAIFLYRQVFSEKDRRIHQHEFLLTIDGLLKLSIAEVLRLASRSVHRFLNAIYGAPRQDSKFLSYLSVRSFRVSFVIAFSYLVLLPIAPLLGIAATAGLVSAIEDDNVWVRVLGYALYPLAIALILAGLASLLRLLIKNINTPVQGSWRNQISEIERVFLGFPTKFTFSMLVAFIAVMEIRAMGALETYDESVVALVIAVAFAFGFLVLATIGGLRVLFKYGMLSFLYTPVVVFLNIGRIAHYVLIAAPVLVFVSFALPNWKFSTQSDDTPPLKEILLETIREIGLLSNATDHAVLALSILGFLIGVYPYFARCILESLKVSRTSVRLILSSVVVVASFFNKTSPIGEIDTALAYSFTAIAFIMANAFGDNVSAAISRYIFWSISISKRISLLPVHLVFDLLGIVFSVICATAVIWICMLIIMLLSGLGGHLENPAHYLSQDQLQGVPWYSYVFWGSSLALAGIAAAILMLFGETAWSAVGRIDFFSDFIIPEVWNQTEGGILIAMAVGVLFGFLTSILPTILNFLAILVFMAFWGMGNFGQKVAVHIGRFIVCEKLTDSARRDRIETVFVGLWLIAFVFVLLLVGSLIEWQMVSQPSTVSQPSR